MAVRTSASTTSLSHSSISISDDAFTIAGWIRLTSDRNAVGTIAIVANAGGTRFKTLSVTASGTLLRITSSDFTTVTGTDLSVGTWYHVALVGNGTATTAYLNGAQDITTTDAVAVTTYTQIYWMSDTAFWIDGRIAYLKMWDAALTVNEIAQEMSTIRPQRFVNLYGWWPTFPGSTERARDYAGTGRNLTENGALTDEDPPPVSWGAPVLYVVGQPSAAPPSTASHRLPLLGVG